MYIAPDFAQVCINFLNRVQTTGLDEAKLLTTCAEGLQKAGEHGAEQMAKEAEAAEAEKLASEAPAE